MAHADTLQGFVFVQEYVALVFSNVLETKFVWTNGKNDEAATAAAAQAALEAGYTYCGAIGMQDGEPAVHVEPGCRLLMLMAGMDWAEAMGPKIQQQQAAYRMALASSTETAN